MEGQIGSVEGGAPAQQLDQAYAHPTTAFFHVFFKVRFALSVMPPLKLNTATKHVTDTVIKTFFSLSNQTACWPPFAWLFLLSSALPILPSPAEYTSDSCQ